MQFSFKTTKKQSYRETTMERAIAMCREYASGASHDDFVELSVKVPKTKKYSKLGTYYPLEPKYKDDERRVLVVPII